MPHMPSFRTRFSQLPHVLRLLAFPLTLLAIEFLDELVYGAGQAAWPVIRDDLGLSYVQIGALLSLPGVVGSLIEPFKPDALAETDLVCPSVHVSLLSI